MQISVLEVLKRALRLCGQTHGPAMGIADDQRTEVLAYLNQLLDGWNTLRGSIYNISSDRYTFTAPILTQFATLGYVTIGPTGDFVATRPERLENASIILTANSPEVRIPLQILDDDQWASIRVPKIAVSLSREIYFDNSNPNRRIYLWGYPNVANALELWTWGLLSTALAYTDTLDIPTGYQRAIVYNLAMEIAPLYWRKANGLLAEVQRIARKSRADIVSANSDAPKLLNDAATINSGPPQPYFNYLTGGDQLGGN